MYRLGRAATRVNTRAALCRPTPSGGRIPRRCTEHVQRGGEGGHGSPHHYWYTVSREGMEANTVRPDSGPTVPSTPHHESANALHRIIHSHPRHTGSYITPAAYSGLKHPPASRLINQSVGDAPRKISYKTSHAPSTSRRPARRGRDRDAQGETVRQGDPDRGAGPARCRHRACGRPAISVQPARRRTGRAETPGGAPPPQ